MDLLTALTTLLLAYLPALTAGAATALILGLAHWVFIARHPELGAESKLPRQLLMLLLTAAGLAAVLLTLPMSETTRGQILGLLGIVLTVVIALSSTTFVANAMAGLMLRMIKTFRPGDFIHVGTQFGRVTERGLFHTEIQTEDHDLTTFPNLHLVTNPITVVHSSGTIISTTLSLGYDLAHARIEELLQRAATEAGLEEPFVLVVELGDFAVTYKVAGWLKEIKQLLTARSNLRKQVLDVLHGEGVEIVSPTVMIQRPAKPGGKLVPATRRAPHKPPSAAAETPEALMFSKAEEAGQLERLRDEQGKLNARLDELKGERGAHARQQRAQLKARIAHWQTRVEAMTQQLAKAAAERDAGESR